MLDGLRAGVYISKDYLDKNSLLSSPSFYEVYKLVRDATLTTSTAPECLVVDESDVSEVYKVMSKMYHPEFVTRNFTANQTNTSIIAAPGVGKRIVIEYVSERTPANSGTSEFISGAVTFGRMTWDAQTTLFASQLHIHTPENTAVLFTNTTGTSAFILSIQYHIEDI